MMRTDLLLAAGLTALVIGATVAVGRAARMREEDEFLTNAIAVIPVVLRERPRPDGRATGYVAPGGAVFVESTGALGWLYVYTPTSEGYAREEDFAIRDEARSPR